MIRRAFPDIDDIPLGAEAGNWDGRSVAASSIVPRGPARPPAKRMRKDAVQKPLVVMKGFCTCSACGATTGGHNKREPRTPQLLHFLSHARCVFMSGLQLRNDTRTYFVVESLMRKLREHYHLLFH